jgi:hypothetical protein
MIFFMGKGHLLDGTETKQTITWKSFWLKYVLAYNKKSLSLYDFVLWVQDFCCLLAETEQKITWKSVQFECVC